MLKYEWKEDAEGWEIGKPDRAELSSKEFVRGFEWGVGVMVVVLGVGVVGVWLGF